VGDEISFTKTWRACRITQIHVSSVTFIYRVIFLLEAQTNLGKVFQKLEKRIKVCLDVKGGQFQHQL